MGYAAMEAACGAMKAAWALHESAGAAAKAADVAKKCGADPDDVLRQACGIWITAAESSERHVQQSQEELPIAAMSVSNEDRSPVGIHG
jgi:hypothetical protein